MPSVPIAMRVIDSSFHFAIYLLTTTTTAAFAFRPEPCSYDYHQQSLNEAKLMDAGTFHSVESMDDDTFSGNGSDSDKNSGESSEYYQPISFVDDGDEVDLSDGEEDVEASDLNQLQNGYHYHGNHCMNEAVNEFLAMDLNDGVFPEGRNGSSEEEHEEEEAEEQRMREARDSERAIWRAFSEDENRRNAPLSSENTMRVMEAMRGIRFAGTTPDWVRTVPEDQWIHQLRRSRQSSSSSPLQN